MVRAEIYEFQLPSERESAAAIQSEVAARAAAECKRILCAKKASVRQVGMPSAKDGLSKRSEPTPPAVGKARAEGVRLAD